jgi:hypothetical protein
MAFSVGEIILIRGGVVSRDSLRQDDKRPAANIRAASASSGLRQYSEIIESSEYIVENYMQKPSNVPFFLPNLLKTKA